MALGISGCAHVPLARNTQRQIRTIVDIQQQQVLDNLAMFTVNLHATPYFAVPNGGGTNVSAQQDGWFPMQTSIPYLDRLSL